MTERNQAVSDEDEVREEVDKLYGIVHAHDHDKPAETPPPAQPAKGAAKGGDSKWQPFK